MLLNDFIFKKNSISKEACNLILNEIKHLNWQKHTFQDNISKQKHNHGEKELDVLFNYPEHIKTSLYPFLNGLVNDYRLKHCEEFGIIEKLSLIRFNRYNQNTEMKNHIDHIKSLFDGEEKGIPVLSIVSVLNDDYEGGEFLFNNKYEVKLNKGDVLIFPSNFMFKHKVNQIKNGTRYSFVCWGY